MKLGTLEGNRELDDLTRILTSKQLVKLYALSEEISTTAAKKKLESLIQSKSQTLTFSLQKNWNQNPSAINYPSNCTIFPQKKNIQYKNSR
jgi:hypothetical protein